MLTTNERKQRTAVAFAALKQAGSMVAADLGTVMHDYWLIDKRNTHMLENWLVQAKRFPRIQAAARKLLPQHCGVKVEGTSKTGFKVTNLELSTKQKVKCMAECGKYTALELTSVLNHPNIKVKVDYVWKKETACTQFKRNVNSMLENGMTGGELLAMIQVAIDADIKAKKDNVAGQPVNNVEPIQAKPVDVVEKVVVLEGELIAEGEQLVNELVDVAVPRLENKNIAKGLEAAVA